MAAPGNQPIWFRVFPPEAEQDTPFHGAASGPIRMPARDSPPILYFYLLFSVDLIKEFVKQTNRYASDLYDRTRLQTGRFSRKCQWRKEGKLTISEFKAFLGVLFNMGLNRKSSIKEYWNRKNMSQSTPWFRMTFARNRFQNVLKFLHIVDCKKIPARNNQNYNPASRVKPLIDFVNRKFLYYYRPRRELSVDETLVGTKGKTAMLQYIPSKRSRFGIKFWVLAEAVTGYVLQMHIYLGKTFEPALPAGTLQGTNVVIKLLQSADLLNKWYHVFTDNFFSSLNLARALLVQRTHLTGTLRKNRPMPNMIKNANPDPGQTTYARQGNILLCSFRDQNRRKQVKLVSTFYSAIRAMNAKPLIVNAYNNFMGGVDLSDQMMAFYNDHRKQTKVWKKIILHMFHRILLNSYILYYQHTSHNPILTRFEFVKQVIEGLTEEHLSNRQQNPGQRQKIRKVTERKEKDCTVCSDRKNGRRRRARTECSRCAKGLHKLCVHRHEC
ncbi:piggyBac transposable element-derived protein 4-like [Mytilus edulis]|uniref:piggyBac transposable element-derived protein 4-like n=1 Tax=Mytilus edulis TaxID=6550 RepID=UPI0039F05095